MHMILRILLVERLKWNKMKSMSIVNKSHFMECIDLLQKKCREWMRMNEWSAYNETKIMKCIEWNAQNENH